ncbi:VTT domain-containing protein [Salinibacterium sp. NSLL150]|uniref:DedA family protein n=1 Tax=unclassified Salinibacterium TaxID=2632331 RepID=UPI0018CCD8C2|nr:MULTISPECIES: VTT domain-containing protein [unclassified Salinibacterium]MBH0099450.1 VTT domain-containing protein [Salinibacterium sp. NSLL35]MBH0102204.1 VTT domain-containing protein [Salinibacterium sp. NSLL150]MBH0104964.1 VTT domain-containing protein [Salinibacterium sp. NSLL16]MBH0107724.1 VTT domain-containing protein [Salinibacterium sp. NSLL17]
MVGTALIPWLDPQNLITGFGAFALLGVAFIVFAETGLLVGFFLPGDTLLLITGVLTFAGVIEYDIWWVCLAISLAAFLGGEVGYLIGHKVGPKIFERKETGLFSVENVKRTNAFFTRFGGLAVIMARFVPIVRTFAPVAAGVGHMDYRKYSLYNAIGALIWGSGLTFGGYLLGYIPWLSDFIVEYIDLILLAAVTLTVLPTAYHYFRSSYKAKKARETGRAEPLDDAEAEKLALHPKDFNQDFDD